MADKKTEIEIVHYRDSNGHMITEGRAKSDAHPQISNHEEHKNLFQRIGDFFKGGHITQAETDHHAERPGYEATGKIHIVRSMAIRTEVDNKHFEAGHLDVVDKQGNVIFTAQYNTGGKGHGAPAFQDSHIAVHTRKNLTLIGGKVVVPHALAISSADTPGETGIYIHRGGVESHGCYHLDNDKMEQLAALWDKIPTRDKSLIMRAEKDTSAYAQTVALLESKGLYLDQQHGGERLAHGVPHHPQHLASTTEKGSGRA